MSWSLCPSRIRTETFRHDETRKTAERRQITGANGTIGYACTVYALRLGYRVRCVVRSEDAIQTLKHGPSLQQFASQIDYHIVSDNTVPDSYDSALADVQYVIHVAGVWPTPVSVLSTYVRHDLDGNAEILRPCRTNILTTTSIYHLSSRWKIFSWRPRNNAP